MPSAINAVIVVALCALHLLFAYRLIFIERALRRVLDAIESGDVGRMDAAIQAARKVVG